MKRQFLLNIILLLVINVLVKPFYVFFVETKVQNTLGTAEYGYYFFHLNFVFLFQFIGDLGLQTWNQQFTAKNRASFQSVFSSVVGVKLSLTLLATIILMVFGWLFGQMNLLILFLISVNLFLSSWFILMRSFLSGMGHYTTDSVLSASDKFFMIVVILILLYVNNPSEFSIYDFIYGQMFSLLVANFVLMIKLKHLVTQITFFPDFKNMLTYVKQCIPYAIVLFLMTGYNKLDGYLLGRLPNDGGLEAGIYAASYRIYDALNMFLYMIPALVIPMFSFMVSRNEDIRPLYLLVGKWMFVLLSPLIIMVLFYGNELNSFLYIDYIHKKTLVLKILMVAAALVCYAYIFGALAIAGDKIKFLIPVFVAGLILNGISNLILIPVYGATGAAMATLLTQSLVFAGQYYVVRKHMGFRWDLKTNVKGLTYTLVLSGLFWLTTNIGSESPWLYIMICLIFSLPLAFVLKLVEPADIKLILSNKIDHLL